MIPPFLHVSVTKTKRKILRHMEPHDARRCRKFNLKQLLNKNGAVNMDMLERLLESTSISATDVETGQTLLDFACRTNNISLAKLCYRRGADLHACGSGGETPFNIATSNKSYRLMECLRMYGVRVNSGDATGKTALHVASSLNDVDGVCRLIEWGADINARDSSGRTPLHYAAIAGHFDMSMFLLELGADLNAVDTKRFTAVAHAEAHDHFKLMDRLVLLGGRGHQLEEGNRGNAQLPRFAIDERTALTDRFKDPLGHVKISPLYLKKSSSLNRLGKYAMPASSYM